MVQIAASPITLDPSDPFDAALIPHRRDEPPKRADYAKDGDRSTTSDVVAASRAVKGVCSTSHKARSSEVAAAERPDRRSTE